MPGPKGDCQCVCVICLQPFTGYAISKTCSVPCKKKLVAQRENIRKAASPEPKAKQAAYQAEYYQRRAVDPEWRAARNASSRATAGKLRASQFTTRYAQLVTQLAAGAEGTAYGHKPL